MSSTAALLQELQQLRRDLSDIASRVLALETQVGLLQESSSSGNNLTVNYLGGAAYPTETSSTAASTAAPATPDRREVAVEIGHFIRRRLDGFTVGESGRSKIRLQSRVYVVARDFSGKVLDPVRVFSTVAAFQHLVKREGATTVSDESIFVGFPSTWEAKVAVETAGLRYPADGRN